MGLSGQAVTMQNRTGQGGQVLLNKWNINEQQGLLEMKVMEKKKYGEDRARLFSEVHSQGQEAIVTACSEGNSGWISWIK